mgnify:CR=1 FL=1
MNKPGVMIYFNMIPSSRLPDADRLRLYDAMMEYGRTGTEPEFDGPLGIAWDYVAPVLALDDNRYEQTRAKRSMAGKLSGIGLWFPLWFPGVVAYGDCAGTFGP